jgi:hypothetical protein
MSRYGRNLPPGGRESQEVILTVESRLTATGRNA